MSMSFEEQQALLRQKFAERTKGEADQLETLAKALLMVPSEDKADKIAAIRNIAHRLAGGAAIFGLAELGDPARDVESMIDENGKTPLVCAQVMSLVDAIRQALNGQVNIAPTAGNGWAQ